MRGRVDQYNLAALNVWTGRLDLRMALLTRKLLPAGSIDILI